MTETINCCPKEAHAEAMPLIYTLKFPGAEYWCASCGFKCGMFDGTANELPESEELVASKNLWEKKAFGFLNDIVDVWEYEFNNAVLHIVPEDAGPDVAAVENAIGFLDLETGGFSISKNGVCEIALVITDQQLNIVETFQEFIKPYKREDSDELVSYKEDAFAKHGISEEFLHEYGNPVEIVILKLAEFMKKHGIVLIVGQNVKSFDLPRVKHLFKRFYNFNPFEGIEVFDTLHEARNQFNFPGNKMEDLCLHFDIVNEKAHSAESDCKATIQLYSKLI